MSNLIVPIVLFISSLGLVFTYILPSYETLQALQIQETRLEEANRKLENVTIAKNKLMQQFNGIPQRDLDRLDLVLPKKTDVVETIIILDKLARENNLTIESFGLPGSEEQARTARARTEEVVPDFQTAAYTIVIYGTYENLKRMLYQVERSVALMDVAELYIEPVGNTKKEEEIPSDVLKHTIVLHTYFQNSQ